MKVKYLFTAALILSICGNCQAQSLLERAKNAAGKKIENAINNKSGNDQNAQQNSSSQNYDTQVNGGDDDYAARLIPEDEETTFNYTLIKYFENGNTTTKNFKTYAEAIAAMPALPTAKDMTSESTLAAYRTQLINYQVAVENMRLAYMDAIARLSTMGAKASRGATAPSEAQMAQRQAVSAAFSKLSKEELAKIEKMSDDEAMAYMQKNHPEVMTALTQSATAGPSGTPALNINEEKADAYDELHDKLMDVQDKANESMYTDMFNNELQTDFAKLRKEILDSWTTSAEYAKVNQMEAELKNKVNEYTKSSNGRGQEYPPFWTAERKKQNEVIDQWNAKQAEKWLAKIADWQKKYKALAEEIATLDANLEQVRNGDEEDFMYLQTKMISATLNDKVIRYTNLSGGVFCFPQIQHVQEKPVQ